MKFFHTDESVVRKLENATLGGVTITGQGELKLAMMGDQLQMTDVTLEPGYYHPPHSHPENESIGYVFSGKIKMIVGGEEHILTAGDTWIHPKGVEHSTLALERSHFLEMHTPLRPEFLDLWKQNQEKAGEA